MAMPSPTNPRKSASQERSRMTVEAILDATARVLVREGYARTSTNRVAAVAGVSIGSLYQYFPNKGRWWPRSSRGTIVKFWHCWKTLCRNAHRTI